MMDGVIPGCQDNYCTYLSRLADVVCCIDDATLNVCAQVLRTFILYLMDHYDAFIPQPTKPPLAIQ